MAKDIRVAIKKSDTGKVVEIIGSNSHLLNMETPFGTWLHVAASRGELDIVKTLIDLGADVNRNGGAYGGGALNEAASAGHIEIVKYLISCGADMDVSEPERNPLFGSISNGHVDTAKLLIESGIDTAVKYNGDSMREMDALSFAKEHGQSEIIDLLKNLNEPSSTTKDTNIEKHHQDEIIKYIKHHLGSVDKTIHEIVPGSRVEINVNVIPPSKNKEFLTLVTTGMSSEPMDYSNDEGVYKYAEVLIKLPSGWIIDKENSKEQEKYWPLEWLKKVAHIPHIYDGWIEEGVIIPNGEPPQPFADNTKLSSVMICKPYEIGLKDVMTKKGDVQFFTLVPIYEEERNLALEKGHQYLLDQMKDNGITDVLDINRINVGLM